MPNLKGKVAVVTGASRGAGRGIALVLGEAGATVYVTGRSVRGDLASNKPGTIDNTAEEIEARGGIGIPIRCDHTVDSEVEAAFERVKRERGRLDILVNNAWGGNELAIENKPFWELSLAHWNNMFPTGVRACIVSSRFAVPLMLPQKSGLIVSTSFCDRNKYIGHLFYDLAKNAINRAMFAMSCDLRPHNIAAIALSPGFMRTELVLAHFQTDEQNYKKIEALQATESVEYIGRAVAALAADPNVMQKTGQVLLVGELAREYSFTDIDGRQIPPFVIPDLG
jgi:NAD(P)-dependent dehydrogenase (short-subunit alcohol dehydrogenase family)